jgi:uncharacterized membrane protein YfcA
MIAIASIVVLIAGLIKGITTFGFALVAVPPLLIFLSPKLVVPVVTVLSASAMYYMLIDLMKYVQIKRIIPLIIGGVAGIPFGVHLLIILRPELLKILIGVVITVFALFFLCGFRKEIKNEKPAFVLLGFISGVLGGSTSLAGPPVILFFINQNCDKCTFRANMTLYFAINFSFSFLWYLNGQLITGEVMRYSILLFIPMIVGLISGIKLVNKVNEKLFQQISLMIIIVSGLASIINGLIEIT